MNLFGGIKNFFGKLFGGGDDEEKKRKQQAQAQAKATAAPRPAQAPAQQAQAGPVREPVNELNLVLPENLKKITDQAAAQPKPAPAPAPKPATTFKALDPVGKVTQKVLAPAMSQAARVAGDVGNAIGQTGLAKAVDKSPIGGVNRFVVDNLVNPVISGTKNTSDIVSGKKVIERNNKARLQAAIDAVNMGTAFLPLKAPGATKLAEWAGERLAPGLLQKAVTGTIMHGAESGLQGGTISGLTSAKEGNNPRKVAEDTAAGLGLGTLLGAGASGLSKVVGKVFGRRGAGKAVSEVATDVADQADTTAARAVDEVAPGVKSTNPSREADALAAAEAQAAKEADDLAAREAAAREAEGTSPKETPQPETPPVANVADNAVANAATPEPAVASNTIDDTIRGIQEDSQAEFSRFRAENPEATPQEMRTFKRQLDQETNDMIAQIQREQNAAAVPEARAAAPEPQPQVIEEQLQAAPPSQAGAAVDTVPEVAPLAAAQSDVPAIPDMVGNGDQVAVAPRTREAAMRELGELSKQLPGDGKFRETTNLEELKNAAMGVVANVPDQELVDLFGSSRIADVAPDAKGFSILRAARDRLSALLRDDPTNGDIAEALNNTLDAMAERSSGGGLLQRVVQEEFDSMPIQAKVRYILKKIDSANAEVDGYTRLLDDPERAAAVEAKLTEYLQGSEAIAENVSAIQAQLNAVADAARNGEAVDVDTGALIRQLQDQQQALQANNGELVKFYQTLVPEGSIGQKTNDFARTAMLASFTGRVNDLLTTGANVLNLGTEGLTRGLIAKAINLFSPGKVLDTTRGSRQFFEGTGRGLRKAMGEFRGSQYADDLERSLRSNEGARTGLQKTGGRFNRTVQAATELATNATEGVTDQRLYQMAVKEAQELGIDKDLVQQYARARAAVPSRQMREAAQVLHQEINNLNSNPITQMLNRVSASIEGKSAAGGFLKNQIIPFTSWLGGNIWNSVTDRNVIASTIKFGRDAVRGNVDGAVRNLARGINGLGEAYAIGYAMTQAGLITNQDAEGRNDAGAYFKLGDRYIPVGFIGAFAPNIILGNAVHNAMANPDNEGVAAKIADSAGQSLENMARFLNLNSALGADNNASRALEAMTRAGGSAADGVATFASGAAGQFIPALTGDINAVLDNYTGFNPTKEKADTKVTKENPDTGRERTDVPATSLNQVLNKIPFVSQGLPRKAGVAAKDLFDRVTKGNRDTEESAAAREDKMATEDQTRDFKARGIPNPEKDGFEDAVKARVEDGEFDSAIEGLQAKLERNRANEDIPESKNKKIEEQIKEIKVLKDGNFSPSIAEKYKATSLTEWRNMGDPDSEDYNPEMYQKLWDYDEALAKSGVSKNETTKERQFFSAKKAGKGGRGGGGGGSIKSNTIGSTPKLSKVSFGDLAPQKVNSAKIPTIQQVKPGELIKKRKISVGR